MGEASEVCPSALSDRPIQAIQPREGVASPRLTPTQRIGARAFAYE
jgi:hypothetical protein